MKLLPELFHKTVIPNIEKAVGNTQYPFHNNRKEKQLGWVCVQWWSTCLASIRLYILSLALQPIINQPTISKQKTKNRISQPDEVRAEKPVTSIALDIEDWFPLQIRNKRWRSAIAGSSQHFNGDFKLGAMGKKNYVGWKSYNYFCLQMTFRNRKYEGITNSQKDD